MEAPGYFLHLPPTRLKARFIMIEESSKTLYDVDLETAKLGNPESWKREGITAAALGERVAIMIPVRLNTFHKERLAALGGDPDFECGKLVSITRQEDDLVFGNVIGRVNVKPFAADVLTWDKLKEYKGQVIHDEMRNGLLARLYGGRTDGHTFVHADVLQGMPRPWHQDATVLNDELDQLWASGDAIEQDKVRWALTDDNEDGF